jgi:hypothetical protein
MLMVARVALWVLMLALVAGNFLREQMQAPARDRIQVWVALCRERLTYFLLLGQLQVTCFGIKGAEVQPAQLG